jgi:hypothetical protein
MLIWLHFLDTYTLKAVGQEEFADVKVPEVETSHPAIRGGVIVCSSEIGTGLKRNSDMRHRVYLLTSCLCDSFNSTYYGKDYRAGAALLRARRPYLFKNVRR